MKYLLIIVFFTCALFSCKKKTEFNIEKFPQKWQLVLMSGQIANSETKGSNMAWQESYALNADGTFIKSRERNGSVSKASGKFSIKDSPDGKYLLLTYSTSNDLIGSCSSIEKTETLTVNSDIRLLSTWSACDGPGLEYKRTE